MQITSTLINESLGSIGNVFFFVGALIMVQRKRSAFYHQILGNLFYVVQSYLMVNWSLGILSVVLIGVNVWSIINWKRLEAKHNV